MKSKRRRVDRAAVRENAKKGDGGASWFTLPEGVKDWAPEKKGTYSINVLPYKTTDKNHPDNQEPGSLWYKRIFTVHHGVGASNASIVCPSSIGKKCPIHEERNRLLKEKGGDEKAREELTKQLNGQRYSMFNVQVEEEGEDVMVFVMSTGKFWAIQGGKGGLKKEIEEGDEDNLGFFDTQGGKTLKVRFSEESYSGRSFLQVSRIDFEDREDLDEEETLAKTVNLDEILNVLDYDKIKKLFFQEDEEDEDKSSKKKSKSSDDEDDEDSDDDSGDDDDGDEQEERRVKKSDKSSKKTSTKAVPKKDKKPEPKKKGTKKAKDKDDEDSSEEE